MADKKSFNLDAQLGGDTDDMELCQRYGLDPALAYTPKINDAIFNAVQKESEQDLLRGGMEPRQAVKTAQESSEAARAFASGLRKDGQVD